MTPLIQLLGKRGAKDPTWMRIDMTDVEGVNAFVVVPWFGREHHCGMDCWCQPAAEATAVGAVIQHNAEH